MDDRQRPPEAGAQPAHVVVVLNWHGRDDTLACVESLVMGSPESAVLVVDNGSFDGTLDAVRSRWAHVRTLQLDENTGFSGGMNRGIRQALGLGAGVVTVLNNDTVVPPGALAQLRSAATDDLAVSPTVMYRDAPDEIWFGGGTLDVVDAFPHHTDPADLGPCRGGIRLTTLLAGCCITATATAWQRVGLFDERFFLNFEDSEWSLRAAEHGVRLGVACEVRILHAVSASFSGSAATLGSFYYVRNGLLFNRIAGGGVRSRLRFIRRAARGTLRDRSVSQVWRTALVVGWAAAAFALRRFGPAPRALQRMARKWSGSAAAGPAGPSASAR